MSPSHYCPLLQLTSSSSPLLTSSTSLPSVKLATSLSHLRHLKILVENIPCFQHTEKGMYCELHNILPELALVSQLKKSSLLQSRVATPGGNMTWYFSKRTYERYTKTDFIVSWSTDLWTPSICPSNINIWSYSFHLSVEFVLLCSLPSSTSLSLKSSGGPQPDQCWALQITQVLHNAHALHMLLSSLMLCRENLEDDTDGGGSLQLVALHPERPLLCNALQWVTIECLKQKSPSRLTSHHLPPHLHRICNLREHFKPMQVFLQHFGSSINQQHFLVSNRHI